MHNQLFIIGRGKSSIEKYPIFCNYFSLQKALYCTANFIRRNPDYFQTGQKILIMCYKSLMEMEPPIITARWFLINPGWADV